MQFNQSIPNIIHLDVNSCFATIEQQANPFLRDRPVAVCSYLNPSGCILAASYSAKKFGVKTGRRLIDAKKLVPDIITLLPDPNKYRCVHKKIKKILSKYSSSLLPKSIDEFVLKLKIREPLRVTPLKVGLEIKEKIKKEIGEYITVSIGISTNKYLAKIASNLKKPDGLSVIDKDNFLDVFGGLKLTDLTGIKEGNSRRLNLVGIKTVLDFYSSSLSKLKIAFGGINGYYWFLNLRGYDVDDSYSQAPQKTYGNSYAIAKSDSNKYKEIITKLVQKTGLRLRNSNLKATGVHLYVQDRSNNSWHMGRKTQKEIFDSNDLYFEISRLLNLSPIKNDFRNIAISTFGLKDKSNLQLEVFEDIVKKDKLNKSLDSINNRFGEHTIYPARMANTNDLIKDRIAFGK